MKIVITGGPCAGKSSAMRQLKQNLESKGYKVYIVQETATEMIRSGLDNKTDQKIFQPCQIKLQIVKEDLITEIASKEPNTIVLCDRGVMDARAFCTEEEFEYSLREAGYTKAQVLSRYDGVFHLETADKNNYTIENNEARSETYQQARENDKMIGCIWKQHKYYRHIPNKETFEKKVNHLTEEILNFIHK